MICVKRFLCGIVSVALVFSFLSFRFVDARENESIPHGQYLAHYFDNPKLQEPSCYEQIDHRIKFDWHSEGGLTSADIRSIGGESCNVRYNGKTIIVAPGKGNSVTLTQTSF